MKKFSFLKYVVLILIVFASISYAATTIQLRRGTLANLPALQDGEPGWVTDIKMLYIGQDGISIPVSGSDVIDSRGYATIEIADAAAYADGKLLVVAKDHTLTANTVLTASIMRIPGGSFTKASTYTLTFSARFQNPDKGQCFIGFGVAGAKDVMFGPGTAVEPYPEWWQTNTTPGTTDMLLAINAAARSIRPEINANDRAGGIVRFNSGRYTVKGKIVGFPGMVFKGEGRSPWGTTITQKGTWIDHQPTVADTDCFEFDLSAWDTYGRATACGITDMYITGTTNSRRMISYPNGFIRPVLERVWTKGGSVGLYGRYGISTNIYDSVFDSARDYGVYFGYVTNISTSISFWGCHIWGQGITKTGLYADGVITTYFYGGVIDECIEYLVRGGVTAGVQLFFIGVHFEGDLSGGGYVIRVGEYSGAISSVSLTDSNIHYTYSSFTNKVGVAADYAVVRLHNSLMGPGYAFSATANTTQVYISSGCVWGNNFNYIGVPAAATSAEMAKIIGNSISGKFGGFAGAGHRSGYHADLCQTVTYAANIVPNPSLGGIIYIALTGDITIAIPDAAAIGYTVGSIISFDFQADGSSRLVKWNTTASPTWKTQYATGGSGSQEETVSAGTRHTIRFYWDGTNWVQLGATAVIVN